MRKGVIGAALLVAAVAIGWAIVMLGQARAGGWAVTLLGRERALGSPPLFETVATVLVYAPLMLFGVVAAAIDRRNALAPGGRPLFMFGLGLLIGAAGLTGSALYAKLAGGIVQGEAPALAVSLLAWGLGVVVLQVVAEEVFFRGWLQPALARRWGLSAAVVAGAIAFAVLHIAGGARAPVSLVNLFLGGLMFGLLAARGGGIAAPVAAHLAWNAAEQLIFGLDPNGADGQWLGGFGAVLNWDARGSPIWGGSEDGLNGSVGMTFALLAILVPLVVLVWRAPVRGEVGPAFAVV